MKKKALSLIALASLMILGGCGRFTSDVSDPFHPDTGDTTESTSKPDTSKPSSPTETVPSTEPEESPDTETTTDTVTDTETTVDTDTTTGTDTETSTTEPDVITYELSVTNPTKTEYKVNETFVADGLSVKLITVTNDVPDAGKVLNPEEYELTIDGAKVDATYRFAQSGEYTVVVTYLADTSVKSEFKVFVEDVISYRLEVTKPSITEVNTGSTLDLTGLKVFFITTTNGKDAKAELSDDEYTIKYNDEAVDETYKFNTAGEYTFTVEYVHEQTTYHSEFTVTVKDVITYRLDLTNPTKTEYNNGDILNLEGMKVEFVTTTNGNDAKVELERSQYTIKNGDEVVEDNYELTTSGTITFTVSYEANGTTYEKSFSVEVKDVIDYRFEIKNPTKTVYNYKDKLDLTGLEATFVTITNGEEASQVLKQEEYVVKYDGTVIHNGDELKNVGDLTLSVEYTFGNKVYKQSFNITVNDVITYSLSVQGPTKQSYIEGEKLDITGLKVTLTTTKNDVPSSQDLTSGYILKADGEEVETNCTLNTAGTITFTVEYTIEGKTLSDTFEVTVNEKLAIASDADTVALPGESIQLSANKEGIAWSSSDDTIATVSDEGLVTFKKDGDVTITAKLGDEVAEKKLSVAPTNLKTIAEINASDTANFRYTDVLSIRGTIISKEYSGNVMISDGTSSLISFYKSGEENPFANKEIGDKVLVTAKAKHYFSVYELDKDSDVKVFETTKFDTEISKDATKLTKDEMVALGEETAFKCGTLYSVDNAKFVQSGKYVNLNVEGTAVKTSIKTKTEEGAYELDKWGTLDFYFEAANTSSSVITMWVESFTANPETDPTSLKLSDTEKTMTVGDTYQLSVEFLSGAFDNVGKIDESVTWSTNAPDFATVTDGLVTAKKEGTATITATSVAYPSLSATCEITINPASESPLFVRSDTFQDGDVITFTTTDGTTEKAMMQNTQKNAGAVNVTVENNTFKDAEDIAKFTVRMLNDKEFRLENVAIPGTYLTYSSKTSLYISKTGTGKDVMTLENGLIKETSSGRFMYAYKHQDFRFYANDTSDSSEPLIYVLKTK